MDDAKLKRAGLDYWPYPSISSINFLCFSYIVGYKYTPLVFYELIIDMEMFKTNSFAASRLKNGFKLLFPTEELLVLERICYYLTFLPFLPKPDSIV